MSLLGSARGLDPSSLTYSWSASSGTFDNATIASPTLTCTSVGDSIVTLVVSDGSDAANCTATATVTVSCTN